METKGRPTVILAQTVKGYGLGEAGEGRNITHQQKKLNEKELKEFRTRFSIPISDSEVSKRRSTSRPRTARRFNIFNAPQPWAASLPTRSPAGEERSPPKLERFQRLHSRGAATASLDHDGLCRLLWQAAQGPEVRQVHRADLPRRSRAPSAWKALFRQCGIYAHAGQLYEPVDSETLLYYREAKDGQFLEEGITEAGGMASFIAAGTAYSSHGINMIPFFIYYSMFGFQRIGDLIWAAGDCRAKGFMLGGTAGRTTLAGEGLQHQDGQSLLNAMASRPCRPTIRPTPTKRRSSFSMACGGCTRGEAAIYYITLYNENYRHPPCRPVSKKGFSAACTRSP